MPEESKQMPPCDEPWDKFLSDSAIALLRALKVIEEGADLNLFQPDPYLDKLKMMASTYRGSLHSAACQKLERALSLGGVSVVSSTDIMSLLSDSLWRDSISELSGPEMILLRRLLEDPSSSLNEMAAREKLTYSRVRRAFLRMSQSGVLRMEGMLNYAELGLERMLVIMENPTLVLRSEYIEHMLFVDGPSAFAYEVVTYPMDKQNDVQQYVRHMRSTAENISMFRLGTGRAKFSDFYVGHGNNWYPNMLHFRLVMRNGGSPIVMGDEMPPTVASHPFTRSELQVIDIMRRDYGARAADIAHEAGLSESAVFRTRQFLRTKGVVLPRARVEIPKLSERMVVTLPSDAAGDILPAWHLLPLTYMSRITNIEANESRILLVSALPPGAGTDILKILRSETSRADDLSIHVVSAAIENRMSMGALFDRQSKRFRWNQGDFFEAQSYGVVRNEARTDTIPLDLA